MIASYVSGISAQPLIGETIGRYFDRVCDAKPEMLAIVVRHQGVRWT
jgi:fatty-acyl-CoA synthase